jgi:L-ribulose-5-phosphate 3-epimerase
MNPIGIMQGRLSPRGPRPQTFPHATWVAEFDLAQACGFDRIEWLVTDASLHDNPLLSDEGVRRMHQHAARTGVSVTSVCADCFIDRPLIARGDAGRALLERFVDQSAHAGIAVIVLPILENASLRNDAERGMLIDVLRGPLAAAERSGVRIALESDQPAMPLRALIDACGSTALGVCYDLGNSAAAGRDCAVEVGMLGASVIAVHVKDRVRNGGSTPLGNGDVKFADAAKALASVSYSGPLILETPVGEDALESARRNLAFVRTRFAVSIAA